MISFYVIPPKTIIKRASHREENIYIYLTLNFLFADVFICHWIFSLVMLFFSQIA